jgi:HTH-type transcriptional regulator / antitoxin MqsA
MGKNPRDYPETMISAESGRPMTRGEKLVSFKQGGRTFTYWQPGWWCSLTDPEDMDGQLVDRDNLVGELARRTAKAIAHGESVFVPVVVRAIRERLGLSQRDAGRLFGTGEKSFEKYESGDIAPSAPTKLLLRIAWEHPELFAREGDLKAEDASRAQDGSFVREALKAAQFDHFFEPLFAAQSAP